MSLYHQKYLLLHADSKHNHLQLHPSNSRLDINQDRNLHEFLQYDPYT